MTEINNQEQTYKKPGVGAIIGGVVVGSTVNGLVSAPNQLIAPKIMGKMADISRSLTEDEFKTVENAIKTTIEKSGLAEKGVGIVKATAENADEISKIMTKELDNNFIMKHLPEQIKGFVETIFHSMVESGKNAFYTFKSKKIIMPEKELSLALFHEAGHAANQNLSTIGKALQKCRGLTLLAFPISMIALWKTKKAPNQEPKSTTDKTTTFIKENAGKLTFATFIPMLLEEGLASIKGNNFAKKVLSPELARKVSKTNALGFSTYVGLAALSSLGIYLGTKVKDAIAKPKLVEQKE
jgi:hypothetical protein